MNETNIFINTLVLNGFKKFAGVPCSFLSPLINEAENRGIYEPFVNEGDALAYAAGVSLTGNRCAVLMQNSGLSNALSPLTSLNELFGLHTLLIIGNRGIDDEPQHRIMAAAVKPILNSLGIPYFNAEDSNALQSAIERLSTSSAAILVNSKNTFTPVMLNASKPLQTEQLPLRYDILKAISKSAKNSVVITTTGFTSREMYCINDRPENFYMVGSMGCLSSLASGVSDYLQNRKIIAIDGDSACLMRLGALYTLTQKQPKNLCYIVLDNEANESTGGQRNSSKHSRLFDIINSFHSTIKAGSPQDFSAFIDDFISSPRYTQIYARIKTGTLDGLPRPERQLIFEQASRFKKAVLK